MADCLKRITTAANAGKSLVVVYLDITKAFDRVARCRLTKKIEAYGIIDHTLSWFSSCLSSRNQLMNVNVFSCHPRTVTSDAIQGRVPGPLLFILFAIQSSPLSETVLPFYSPITPKSFTTVSLKL